MYKWQKINIFTCWPYMATWWYCMELVLLEHLPFVEWDVDKLIGFDWFLLHMDILTIKIWLTVSIVARWDCIVCLWCNTECECHEKLDENKLAHFVQRSVVVVSHCHVVNTVVVDVLATHGFRASEAILSSSFVRLLTYWPLDPIVKPFFANCPFWLSDMFSSLIWHFVLVLL